MGIPKEDVSSKLLFENNRLWTVKGTAVNVFTYPGCRKMYNTRLSSSATCFLHHRLTGTIWIASADGKITVFTIDVCLSLFFCIYCQLLVFSNIISEFQEHLKIRQQCKLFDTNFNIHFS